MMGIHRVWGLGAKYLIIVQEDIYGYMGNSWGYIGFGFGVQVSNN